MAKGNMLLGYARGKVGDLVFTRIDGEQVSRPRNRHPNNPRTNKQLVQRAIMATIMSAYSAGREIFDHSFQGYGRGAGCQRRFLSLNANALRTQLAAEWDTAAAEESLVKVTGPKIQTPIPNQYVISEGSLRQEIFVQEDEDVAAWHLSTPTEGEKINEYAARVGLAAGDIYTFVFIATSKADADVLFKSLGIASVDFDIVYRGSFGWVRLIAKNLAANETVISNNTKYSDLFDIETGGIGTFAGNEVGMIDDSVGLQNMAENGVTLASNGYAIGIIRSRRDVDLRSNTTLQVMNPAEFGLYWNDLLNAWKSGTTEIGASDLILEGGDE